MSIKCLLVGGSGYIGSRILEIGSQRMSIQSTSRGGDSNTIPLNLEAFDSFDFGSIAPGTYVLFLAAISSPDICTTYQERAWAVNVVGTSAFVQAVIDRGARVLFFSSDTVYGERKDDFCENTICNPAGEYALMKREVEERFAGNRLFKSIRLSFVFSKDDKFSRYLIGCAEQGVEADLFHPFYRSIVHREDVVSGTLALVERWDEFPEKTINFGGPELLSRVDFAESLRDVRFDNLRFKVTEPEADFFKNRPQVIAMKSPVFSRLLGRSPRSLLDAARVEFASV